MEQLPPIELRYLRYFVAVAEELNYRQAAKRLHVSAPALSVQIKNLENLIGLRLFERDTTQVRLTPPGEVLLRESRALFRHMDELVHATREAARGERGRLLIGMPGAFSHSFIPEALNLYRKNFPKVDVTLIDLAVNDEQVQAFEDDRIHLGFIYGFHPPQMKDMDELLVIDTPMHAVMSAQDPLAAQKQVTLAQLAARPLLAIEQYKTQTQELVALFRKKKLEPANLKTASSFNACITMMAAGEGVALLPKMRTLAQNPKLALRPIKDPDPGLRLQVYAVWKKNGAPAQALNFVEQMRKAGVQHD